MCCNCSENCEKLKKELQEKKNDGNNINSFEFLNKEVLKKISFLIEAQKNDLTEIIKDYLLIKEDINKKNEKLNKKSVILEKEKMLVRCCCYDDSLNFKNSQDLLKKYENNNYESTVENEYNSNSENLLDFSFPDDISHNIDNNIGTGRNKNYIKNNIINDIKNENINHENNLIYYENNIFNFRNNNLINHENNINNFKNDIGNDDNKSDNKNFDVSLNENLKMNDEVTEKINFNVSLNKIKDIVNKEESIYDKYANDLILHSKDTWISELTCLYPPDKIIDDLEFLINQEFISSSPDKITIKYIEPKIVVKTKEEKMLEKKNKNKNLPKGYVKDEISIFNTKLFASHSRKMDKLYKFRSIVNLNFYDKIRGFNDEIISADFVDILIYKENYDLIIEKCILIIHKNNKNKDMSLDDDFIICLTLATENDFITRNRIIEEFQYSLLEDKKSLIIIDLTVFKIMKIIFNSEETADFVCKNFFKSEVLSFNI